LDNIRDDKQASKSWPVCHLEYYPITSLTRHIVYPHRSILRNLSRTLDSFVQNAYNAVQCHTRKSTRIALMGRSPAFCISLRCFLRNDQIFSARSFSDIIKELMLHRPSGLLTLWRADDPPQDAIQIIIENGRPTHARRGQYEEYISTSTLLWLNSWRNIYFAFQMKRAILQLPAPDNHLPAVTRPLPAISSPLPTQPQQAEDSSQASVSPAAFTAHIVPSTTPEGRNFPLTALPRYDRTIFLLINGRRTIADLAQLTKRSPAEIYASLTRLQKQQLITME
jgi:hypothetical protein